MTKNEMLVQAAGRGDWLVVQTLIDLGVDVNTQDGQALREASEGGHEQTVRILLNAGAHVHYYQNAALMWAISAGHAVIVKLLIENGANVLAREGEAFERAEHWNNPELYEVLTRYGHGRGCCNGH